MEVDSYYIHDSLAIAEYFNENSNGGLYPSSSIERAQSTSLCSELQSGFMNLRANFPFMLNKVDSFVSENESIHDELSRVEEIFSKAKIPFMFEVVSAVDAFYAILAFRLKIYGVVLSGKAGEYQQSLLSWPTLQQSITLAAEWKSE